jgi:hypothetical protein
MDSVLTRKMFRDRYFEFHKPKKFNKGGIANIQHFQEGGLSSREKAIYAATLAAPLLASTQRQGEGVLPGLGRALSEGVGKLPATIISLAEAEAKAKGKKSVRAATADEKRELGYNEKDRLIVTVEGDTVVGIADKPTFGERQKAADRTATLKQANKILDGMKDTSTGAIQGRFAKLRASLNLDPRAAQFNVNIEEFKKSAIKALRGAQVGPLEEASFDALLPAITDNEDIIRAKVNTMKEKIEEIDNRLDATGTVSDPGNLDYYKDAFAKFGITVDPQDLAYDSKLDFYSFDADGNLVKD